MKVIDLQPYHMQRSEKIRWTFPTTTDIVSHLKSKSLRKFVRKIPDLILKNQIEVQYQPLSREAFTDWLDFYTQKMMENGYDIIASLNWYDIKIETGLTVEGLFLYQNEKLIGSGIFTRKDNHMAVFAFKASEKIDLDSDENASLGAVLDFMFLEKMTEQGVEILSAGRSRNSFGVTNSLGYLDYKLRFGYLPSADTESSLLTEVPVNESGIVLFYGLKNDKLALYALLPQGTSTHFEVSRFATPEIPFEILYY